MIARDELRALVDAIPEDRLPAARDALEQFTDPVLLAFLNAPEDDEPITDEDLAAIEEGRADIAVGRTVPWEAYDPDRPARR